jgi:diguanylate cyclase (GGDEF)-like protein
MLDVILPAATIPATGWAVHATVLLRRLHEERRDPISGLPGRRAWMRRADRLIRRGTANTVLFCDLDDFKAVNDTFGHEAGDAALRAVGHRLQDYIAGRGVASRLGGDEFVAALAVDGDLEEFVDGLREALCQLVPWPGGPLRIGASIGTVRLDDLAEPSASAALGAADHAMLRIKGYGRRGRRAAPADTSTLTPGSGGDQR